ncbi:unconventional myosin-XV-like isoform X2 [Asterias amurensis]|uniref:unconventional myosin-XV-like isoform X2 n=1 Tax=Asterias amurensis TaxID=7602 RepID=UPI003AB90479
MELGTPIWFDSGGEYPLPGRVTETYGGEARGVQVQCVMDGEMYTVCNPGENIRMRHDALEIQHFEDMIQLRDLHEGSILFNLKTRFDKGLIYTYTGSILVAVNPYKLFDIYGIDTVKKYQGKTLGNLPPHLFAIANGAYARMQQTDKNQCVIISGESGAGKTESTKLIMQYLAAVNKSPSNLTTERILEANPLLESFGNAKTVRNDNSSRFGKYTEVFFKRGVITGAKTTDYLLEKSRIVQQGPNERNYHIFYELLAGLSAPEAAKYGLHTAERYHFLNQGGSCKIAGKDDGEDFYRLVSAMEVLSFSPSEQDVIFGILASILHLGNLNMRIDQTESPVIQNRKELSLAAKFLHLRIEELERAIMFRLTETRGDRILTPRTLQQAIEARDGIAKSLYSSLFSWLVRSINTIVGNAGTMTSIAILDIFGFEVFQRNSFEQMCINYANEHLQHFFNKHIFMLEQQEYKKEKIPWTLIGYNDNQQCLDLIGKRPFGIFHILDDECSFPNSSDKSFMDKCHYQHMANAHYSRAKVTTMEYNIRHFAGKVSYDMTGFLEKNRDVLKADVVHMFISSQSQLISEMFASLRRQEDQKAMKMSGIRGDNSMRKMRPSTVATRFNESLLDLISTMTKCNPFFVRCIKPNSEKAAMQFDTDLVLEQLRYSGMLETIHIRKMGFPIRMSFTKFANRYRFLMGPISFRSSLKEMCRTILVKAEGSASKDFVMGTSKVFMRESLEADLELQRSRVMRHAIVTIQKWVRGYQTRHRYLRKREAAILLQSQARKMVERERFMKIKRGMILIQALQRGRMQRRLYQKMLIRHKKMMEEKLKREAQERVRRKAEAAIRAEEEAKRSKLSNISLLEIPADLAICMDKLAGWSNPHSERNLMKCIGQVVHQDVMFSFPLDIDEYPLSRYVNIYFKTPHYGAAIEPINTGFHKLNEIEDQEAVAIFQLILRFTMEEGHSKDKEVLLGNYIAQKGMSNKALRDEIYSQLCNQTWGNIDQGVKERAWLLMANLLSAFPPSKRLYKYLLKYVTDHAYNGYKSHCHQKLLMCDPQALEFQIARTYPPCLLEWKANRQRCSMALVAETADGEEIPVMVNSWTTGEDFAKTLLQKKGITKACHGWSVHMMDDKTRSELSGFDYIMDLISEVEIPPDFPVCESHFLVSSEVVQDRLPKRKFRIIRNNLAQIDALLEMEPVAINSNIPPPPNFPPPHPPQPPPVTTAQSSAGENNSTGQYAKVIRKTSTTNDEVLYASSILYAKPTEKRSSKPLFPGHIHIPEPDYDDDVAYQGDNVYDDTIVVPVSPIHPTVNSEPSDDGSTNSDHTTGHYIRSVSVPLSDSRNRLDDYVDRLFNPVLEMNETSDLANLQKLNKSLRGGGRSPVPAPPPPPPIHPPLSIPGYPNMAPNPVLTHGMMQPTMPAMQPVMPMTMPAVMPATMATAMSAPMSAPAQMVMQPAMYAAAVQVQQQQQQQQQQDSMMQQQTFLNQQTILAQQMQLQQQQQMLESMQSQLSSKDSTKDPLKSSLSKTKAADDYSWRNQPSQESPSTSRPKSLQFSDNVVNIPAESSNEMTTTKLKIETQAQRSRPRVAPAGPALESQSRPASLRATSPGPARSSHPTAASPGSVPTPPPLPPPPPAPSQEASQVKVRSKSGKVISLNDAYRANTIRVGRVVWPPRRGEDPKPQAVGIDWGDYTEEDDPSPPINQDPVPKPTSHIKKAVKTSTEQSRVAPDASLQLMISARAQKIQQQFEANYGKPTPARQASPKKSPIKIPPPVKPKYSPRRSPTKISIDDVHAEAMAKIFAQKAVLDQRSPPEEKPKALSPAKRPTSPLYQTSFPYPPPPPIPPSQGPPPPPPIQRIKVKAEAFQKTNQVVRSESKRVPKKIISTEKEGVHNEAMHVLKSHGHRVRTNTDAIMASRRYKLSDKIMNEIVVPRLSSDDTAMMESMHTKSYPAVPDVFYTYNRVRWRLYIRKEVFTPGERLDNPMAQQLIFYQIVTDTFSKSCIRMSREEKRSVRDMLDPEGINPQNAGQKTKLKKDVIEMVRKFPLYFSRLYPVTGSRTNRQVELLGISESGIRLIKREYDQSKDQLTVLEHIHFSDILQIEVTSSGTIRFTLTNDKVIPLFTHRAQQIRSMIEAYIIDLERDTQYMRAIQDYITRESTLLSFMKGDIIKLTTRHSATDSDWLFGMLDGHTGLFPRESVVPAAGPESRNFLVKGLATNFTASNQEEPAKPGPSKQSSPPPSPSKTLVRQLTQDEMTRFSMVEFASKYFRDYPNKYVMQRKTDGSIRGSLKFMGNLKKSLNLSSKKKPVPNPQDWSLFLDAVSYTNSPIQASLLEFPIVAINKLALECFIALMQLMGDYPVKVKTNSLPQDTMYERILFIFKACFEHREICDEIYCHIIKQTTRNTSAKKLSLLRAWRFFGLLTSYFRCSPTLKPYLFQYLTMVAQTAEYQYGGMAGVCLYNLRKTFRHGGRRLMPGTVEVQQLMEGRMVRRQQVHLPGNMRTMVKVSGSTVVWDILEELCTEMGLQQPEAIKEFGLFGLVPSKKRVVPFQLSDYLMDVTTHFESQDFEYALLFKKVIWNQAMTVSNEFHSSIIFNQLIPDYQSSRLIVMEGSNLTDQQASETVRLAALQHRAADKVQIPTLKDLPGILPSAVIDCMNPQQWLNLIHDELPLLESMSPHEARVESIEIIKKWQLFGSSFFDIIYASDSRVRGGCLLAINKAGIHLLHPKSHELLVTHGFDEVVSSRHLKGNDGRQFVDLKCGNLMVQRVTRLEANLCTEIIHEIGLHMQAHAFSKHPTHPSDDITDYNNIQHPNQHGDDSPHNPTKRWGAVPMPEMTSVTRSPSDLSDWNRRQKSSPASSTGEASEASVSPRGQQEAISAAEGLFFNPNKIPKRDGHNRTPSWDQSSGGAYIPPVPLPPPPPPPIGNILHMGQPRSAKTRQSAYKQAPVKGVSNGSAHNNNVSSPTQHHFYAGRK